MNANELADDLEVHEFTSDFLYVREVVNMLRQFDLAESIIAQQKLEIDALKKDNKELHAIAQRMAMAESDSRKSLQNFKDYPIKTLTDKEILEEWDWDSGEILATDLLDFADAILRKAQEK